MANLISIHRFRKLFEENREFAVIDPREEGIFTYAHLLASSNLPLSRLEILITAAVPNKNTLIILVDDGRGDVDAAYKVLVSIGYTNINKLTGGLGAWKLSGGAIFSGINVPGKIFGEFVEQTRHTPMISARDLHRLMEEEAPLLLDSRTCEEYEDYCIPGSISCPGGELVYRVAGMNLPANQPIVVHCAGRTRGLMGAQSLIDAGFPNPVFALENGTPAWGFEKLEMQYGNATQLPPVPETLPSRLAGLTLEKAKKYGIKYLGISALESFINHKGTLYIIDVRLQKEYARGTFCVPGHVTRNIPGGQLIQNIDKYLITRNARILLIDSDGIRSAMAGCWLSQMGWGNIACLDCSAKMLLPAPSTNEDISHTINEISPEVLNSLIENDLVVICDIRRSIVYYKGHIPGSGFLSRKDLPAIMCMFSEDRTVVLVSDDRDYAVLISMELQSSGFQTAQLEGGFKAWCDQGFAVEKGANHLWSAPNDSHYDGDDFEDSMVKERELREYLAWEVALTDKLHGEPAAPYANQSF